MEFLGTRLESNDDEEGRRNVNRNRKGLPIHLQEVRDEKGRQRLHGAFQGGFSAGYYNTVGSKEGWAPKQFKSGRNVQKDSVEKMNPFDFMDADDIQEFGKEVMGLKEQYNELGSTERELKRKRAINDVGEKGAFGGRMIDDLVVSVNTQMIGERLLALMKQSSKKVEDGETVFRKLLAISVSQSSTSSYGRGYDPLLHAPEFQKVAGTANGPQVDIETKDRDKKSTKSISKKSRSGFGTGIFENEDEDDFDEPVDTREGFNTYIGEDDGDDDFFTKRAKEKWKNKKPAQAPVTKPEISRGRKGGILEGFVSRSQLYSENKLAKLYVAPFPPADWEPVPSFCQPAFLAAKAAEKEEEEKKKKDANKVSIYSYLSTKSKERLDAFLSQDSRASSTPTTRPPSKSEQPTPLPVYSVPTKVAEAALKGFMPFGNDLLKQARYKRFLEDIVEKSKIEESSSKNDPPIQLSNDEANETREFSKAAMIYRPLSNMISSRFTSETGKVSAEKEELPPVRMVRTITKWKPSKLTSRRFGVVHQNDSDDEKDKTILAESKQALNPETMKNLIEEREKMLQDGEILSANLQDITPTETMTKVDIVEEFLDEKIGQKEEVVDGGVESYSEKPSLDLFKAIFADSDDSDEDESSKEKEDSKKGHQVVAAETRAKSPVHEVKKEMEYSALPISDPSPSSLLSAGNTIPSATRIASANDDPASFFKTLRKGKKQAEPETNERKEAVISGSNSSFKPVFSAGGSKAGSSKEARSNAIVGARKKKSTVRVVSYDDDEDEEDDADGLGKVRAARPSAADFM